MGSKELITLSFFVVASSLFAETAADYVDRSAQKYIFGQDDAAAAEVAAGLAKFPNDQELREIAGLLKKKKPPPSQPQQQSQQNRQQGQNDQQQSQSQSDSQNTQQQQKNQNEQSGAGNEQQDSKQSGAQSAPTPAPAEQTQSQRQPSGGGESSPSPGQASTPPAGDARQNASAQSSPTPRENKDAGSSAAPEETPAKKFAGEIKGAGNENQQKPPDKKAEMAEAEAEKEGQMSERQALALLESMKDEEARVRLDERRIQRHVYKDW